LTDTDKPPQKSFREQKKRWKELEAAQRFTHLLRQSTATAASEPQRRVAPIIAYIEYFDPPLIKKTHPPHYLPSTKFRAMNPKRTASIDMQGDTSLNYAGQQLS
jgi:hypothetical protein